MENYYNVKRLALVLAIQAEIEGMKAENKFREIEGHDLTYNEQDFVNKSQELIVIAHKHNEEL